MYQWWKFVHIASVLALLGTHGVSMGVLFRLRRERDPKAVGNLLQLSTASITPFYVSLGAVVVAGAVLGFLGDLWGRIWIWAAIGILLLTLLAMFGMASPYYKRLRFIAGAMADGSQAVTPEQFDSVLRSGRSMTIAWIGIVGLAAILYLMVFQPSFGQAVGPGGRAVAVPTGPVVTVSAKGLKFDSARLTAPAGAAFSIVFDNRDSLQHNVAVFTDPSLSTPLFVGEVFTGPKTMVYKVPPLPAGSYSFLCTVHPFMSGAFEVGRSG